MKFLKKYYDFTIGLIVGMILVLPILCIPLFWNKYRPIYLTASYITKTRFGILTIISAFGIASYYREYVFTIIGILGFLLKRIYPNPSNFFITNSTKIVGSIRLVHPFSTIINAQIVNENVLIRQNTTIGNRVTGCRDVPTIEGDVEIGAGCLVLGSIIIGEGSKLGAGSIVLDTVPKNAKVYGLKSNIKVEI